MIRIAFGKVHSGCSVEKGLEDDKIRTEGLIRGYFAII